MLGKIVFVLDTNSARIDDFEEAVIGLHEIVHPISGDPRTVLNDGDTDPGQPIQQTAFADVGAADDDDLGNCHCVSRFPSCPRVVDCSEAKTGLGPARK